MSVLIKTMEMPKNCGECQFCHTENFTQWCCPTGREDISYDSIPKWCPLEEPKTGKWVKVIDEETSNVTKWHYECDQCRTGRYENGQRYCHNCGAKMGGESDG